MVTEENVLALGKCTLKRVKKYDICHLLSNGPEMGRKKRICIYIHLYTDVFLYVYINVYLYIVKERENRERGKITISSLKTESICTSKWICLAILTTVGVLLKGDLKRQISSCFQRCLSPSALSLRTLTAPTHETLEEDCILERFREELFSDN